jgi:hypothetical protein
MSQPGLKTTAPARRTSDGGYGPPQSVVHWVFPDLYGHTMVVGDAVVTLGRDPACDMPLPGTKRRVATLRFAGRATCSRRATWAARTGSS